jgi:uncharacterized protein
MHPALRHTAHRPWPLPSRPWAWRQSWHDLLFAHWPVAAERFRELVPAELELEEFDNTAWLGVVPFRMAGVTRWPLPAIPGISAFPELNVRTYVSYQGRPGVWFFSLDADNRPAVWAARRLFHLPYYLAQMSCREVDDGGVQYASQRIGVTPMVTFQGRYRPTGPVSSARAGTLDQWLTERYCMYMKASDGRLFRCEIHHQPWPLQPAELALDANTMAGPLGVELTGPAATLHYSRRLDVVVWSPERLD